MTPESDNPQHHKSFNEDFIDIRQDLRDVGRDLYSQYISKNDADLMWYIYETVQYANDECKTPMLAQNLGLPDDRSDLGSMFECMLDAQFPPNTLSSARRRDLSAVLFAAFIAHVDVNDFVSWAVESDTWHLRLIYEVVFGKAALD